MLTDPYTNRMKYLDDTLNEFVKTTFAAKKFKLRLSSNVHFASKARYNLRRTGK